MKTPMALPLDAARWWEAARVLRWALCTAAAATVVTACARPAEDHSCSGSPFLVCGQDGIVRTVRIADPDPTRPGTQVYVGYTVQLSAVAFDVNLQPVSVTF